MTHLRFDDKTTRSTRRRNDTFAPFREFWDEFIRNLGKYYVPGPLLTIDEQLVPFRGRCSFLQYLPSKPDKYGMKIFWIADAENSYPLLGIPYLGRPAGQERQVNLGRNIALELAQPFFKTGRNITLDNFFTDMVLAENLLKNGLTMVGTVRSNKRFLPEPFKTKNRLPLHTSEFAYQQDKTLVYYQGKKKKATVMLSTQHRDGVVDMTSLKKKPEVVLFYNQTKGAVDTIDKLAHCYTVKRKTQRWPLVSFFNCIDLSTIASRCIWSLRFEGHQLSLKDGRANFIQAISESLMLAQVKRRITEVNMPRTLFCTAQMVIKDVEGKVAPRATCSKRKERPQLASPTRKADYWMRAKKNVFGMAP
ncbi:piggyBac transposable element-derived protein 4-like [Littorina saxatilis]|uniref:piggyBac transposable element-derived protein 4-like n=1 Tax=Littorina saxatilis TaxID=31220 RepID=UPI0038B54ACD